MRPLMIRGHVWRVVRVPSDDPLLIDRTGTKTIATTDPSTRTIRISESVPPAMFDRVYLHEAAHAMMEEIGLTSLLSGNGQVLMEEMLAWFLESHSIEIIDAVSESLGRRICVEDLCI